MDEILKPCPFCGGRAELVKYVTGEVKIQCHTCFALISRVVEAVCIEAWNKRAELAMWFADYSMPGESMNELRAEVASLRYTLNVCKKQRAKLEAENARLREENKRLAEIPHEQDLLYMQAYINYQTLKEENARLREERRWIPVEEQLPENGTWVIADYEDEVFPVFYEGDCWWSDADNNTQYSTPIKYQNIPQPPEVE